VVPAEFGDDRQAAMKNDASASFNREGALKKALESLALVATDLDLVAVPRDDSQDFGYGVGRCRHHPATAEGDASTSEKHGGRLALLTRCRALSSKRSKISAYRSRRT
jgi:hypothetical protein